jgi:hypothetical protein
MPSEDEHIAKAEQNEALFREFIAAGTNAEWAAVILFYAALHYVDAWLARSDVHPRSHVTRRQLVWGTNLSIASMGTMPGWMIGAATLDTRPFNFPLDISTDCTNANIFLCETSFSDS